MRLRYFLIALLVLTAATAAAVDSDREFGRRAVVKADPSVLTAKDYIFMAHSSATGTVMRRASLDSIFTMGGMDTTAVEGQRYVLPYNGSTPFAGTPEAGMIQTTTTGVQWYGTVTGVTDWHPVGGASTLGGISDWPSGVSAVEAGFLDGVTSPIQTQIDSIQTGTSGFVVTAPTYSDSACTKGQWAVDATYHYDCRDTDTWDRFAYAGWTNPAPALATINTAVKAAGYNPTGQMSLPDGTNSYLTYVQVTPSSAGDVTYAHWNMYSNGSSSRFAIYDTSGVLVCQSAAVAGTNAIPQLIDAALTGCSLSAATPYLVGVCTSSDGATTNGPYNTNSTSGPETRRVLVACDGSSFTPGDSTSLSATRPVFAWGDSNASR